jgi:hypothetical protein
LNEHGLREFFDDVHFVGAFDYAEDMSEKNSGAATPAAHGDDSAVAKKEGEGGKQDMNKEFLKAFAKNSGKRHKIKVGVVS